METSSLFMNAISDALEFSIPEGSYQYYVGWVSKKVTQRRLTPLTGAGVQLRQENSRLERKNTLDFVIKAELIN